MDLNTIGTISLNLSLILYLIYYIPQDVRNLRRSCLINMSFWFHALLFTASTCDLYYGFGLINQWQYRLVTVVMFTLLFIQHIQLYRLALKDNLSQLKYNLNLLSFIIILLLVGLIPTLHYLSSASPVFIIMGWVERLCAWIYAIPQIIRNYRQHNSAAISPIFLVLAVCTALCDSISAVAFHWGPSSIYGAPISMLLHLFLLYQYYRMTKLSII